MLTRMLDQNWLTDGWRIIPLIWAFARERVTGIEPAPRAWEALILPLNYTRVSAEFSTGSGGNPRYPLDAGALG